MRLRFMYWIVGCAFLFLALPHAAGQVRPSRIPPDAVAWWRMDPTRFKAIQADPALRTQRDFVIAGLRAAVASGVIVDPRAAAALEGLLAASEVGSRIHTLCLLDLKGTRPPSGTGMKPELLRMALELETGADHASLLRTLRAILIGDTDDKENPGVQRVLTLPGDVRGAAYRRAEWAPWREISWASTDTTFVIGLGTGALDRWFAAQQEDADPPAWEAHQQYVDDIRPPGDVFFQAYMGLDKIRHGFPEAFMQGRVRRLLETLHLSNASGVMLHGRWIDPPAGATHPPMLAMDITWSARSERPGVVHGQILSEARWPAGALSMPPPPGSYIIAMNLDWDLWMQTALELVPAAGSTNNLRLKQFKIQNWKINNQKNLDLFLSQLEPWLVISDVPTPITPIPGAATFFAEFRRGISVKQAADQLSELLSSRASRIQKANGVWSFRVDSKGILRIPAWGFVGPKNKPILVGGWGPPVVTDNRERLGDPLATP